MLRRFQGTSFREQVGSVCGMARRAGSSRSKVIDADDAVHLIQNAATVAVSGFVAMGSPEEVLAALGRRYREEQAPKDLTLLFQGGPGDWEFKGLNHLAQPGMVKRAIGSHYGQVPQLGKMALEGSIEAYNLPMGAVSRMIRCAAAKQPAHISSIGVGTMIDPRLGGGKINSNTKEDLVTDMELDGERLLVYKAVPVDVAIIRGSFADPDGNITFTREALYGDALIQAMAARSRRGVVIAQVEHIAARGSLNPRDVLIPGTMVDCVVHAKPENHSMGYFMGYDPTVTGETRAPPKTGKPMKLDIRKIIARRAALEILPNMVVNLGIGMPEGVAMVADEEHCLPFIELTTEPGIHGGAGLSGHNFGPAQNYSALLTMDHQFDFYNGGGLDIAFLGNAETDEHGHVNVTRVGDKLTGPGGFIDITQATKKVNLMGTFTAGGLKVDVQDGKLRILKEGRVQKFIKNVKEITFSGDVARQKKQVVNYITERCVFNLTSKGLELTEIAPGIDLQKDVLDHMGFRPIIREPLRQMDASIFTDNLMQLRQKNFGGGAKLNMERRIVIDKENAKLFVDMYNLNFQSLDQLKEFEAFMVALMGREFAGGKANVVVTYDGFEMHPDLVEDFTTMQKRLEQHYLSIRRYSAAVFRRHKLGQLIGVACTDVSEGSAHIISDYITLPELKSFIHTMGFQVSDDEIGNLYVKMFGSAETIPRGKVQALLRILLRNASSKIRDIAKESSAGKRAPAC